MRVEVLSQPISREGITRFFRYAKIAACLEFFELTDGSNRYEKKYLEEWQKRIPYFWEFCQESEKNQKLVEKRILTFNRYKKRILVEMTEEFAPTLTQNPLFQNLKEIVAESEKLGVHENQNL